MSNTDHEGGPAGTHLTLKDPSIPVEYDLPMYGAGRAQRYSAGVYEIVGEETGDPEVRHQRAELRPLQDVQHQGPRPEHQLGRAEAAAGRLSQYVRGGRTRLGVPRVRGCQHLFRAARRAPYSREGQGNEALTVTHGDSIWTRRSADLCESVIRSAGPDPASSPSRSILKPLRTRNDGPGSSPG
ncbi:hypothetical protein AB5I41_13560 [Sphingomonas sp. MMS24-JH45]